MAARLTESDLAELGLTEPDGIRRVPWEAFDDYLDREWEAGQHVSVFAPTDGGKTYLIRHGLLEHWRRYPVLWIQYKHRDATLTGWGNRVREFPGPMKRLRYASRRRDSDKWDTDPEWFRLQLENYRWSPDGRRQSESWRRAREAAGSALDACYREGGWVLVVDEVRALADGKEPALSLSAPLENCWQRGRSQPLTVIAATQQPASAPSSMYDQPRWVFLGRTLDVGRYQRISELGGDTEGIKAALPGLRRFEFLAVDRWHGRTWIVRVPSGASGAGRKAPPEGRA